MDRAAFEGIVEVFTVGGRAIDHCCASHLSGLGPAKHGARTLGGPGFAQSTDIVHVSCGDTETERVNDGVRARALHPFRNLVGIQRLQPCSEDLRLRGPDGVNHWWCARTADCVDE